MSYYGFYGSLSIAQRASFNAQVASSNLTAIYDQLDAYELDEGLNGHRDQIWEGGLHPLVNSGSGDPGTVEIELDIGAEVPLLVTVGLHPDAFFSQRVDTDAPGIVNMANGQDFRMLITHIEATVNPPQVTAGSHSAFCSGPTGPITHYYWELLQTGSQFRVCGFQHVVAGTFGSSVGAYSPIFGLYREVLDSPYEGAATPYIPTCEGNVGIPYRNGLLGYFSFGSDPGSGFVIQTPTNVPGNQHGTMGIDARWRRESDPWNKELDPITDLGWFLSGNASYAEVFTPTPYKNLFIGNVNTELWGSGQVIQADLPMWRLVAAEWVAAPPDPTSGDPGSSHPDDESPPETDDGRPPSTTANPPLGPPGPHLVPVPIPSGGGCRASIDGASSCDFDVPIDSIDDFPLPGDEIEFPDFDDPDIPDFTVPDFPIDEIDFPDFPPIGCGLPNFGNLADCKPKAGTGGGLPGGRDNKGRRGSGHIGIKLGGPTYKNRHWTFNQHFPRNLESDEPVDDPATGEPVIPPQRSWPAGSSVMTAIMVILLDLGISPLRIIFEIGPEWDKTFGPKTFPETTRMFSAAQWLARLLMCQIIDEGAPTGNIYIGPPTHRPHSQTWTFMDYFPNPEGNPPVFNLAHGYSSTEAYFAVKVWGAHFSPPKFALVDTPFANDPGDLLEIEVGPDYTPAQAQQLAYFRAALIKRATVSVQATVPYNESYFMRDEMVLKFPSRGFQETYTIFGKQSDIGIEGNTHILTGVLPATLEELANFPDVLEDPVPVGESLFALPELRAETKKKAEALLA